MVVTAQTQMSFQVTGGGHTWTTFIHEKEPSAHLYNRLVNIQRLTLSENFLTKATHDFVHGNCGKDKTTEVETQ